MIIIINKHILILRTYNEIDRKQDEYDGLRWKKGKELLCGRNEPVTSSGDKTASFRPYIRNEAHNLKQQEKWRGNF